MRRLAPPLDGKRKRRNERMQRPHFKKKHTVPILSKHTRANTKKPWYMMVHGRFHVCAHNPTYALKNKACLSQTIALFFFAVFKTFQQDGSHEVCCWMPCMDLATCHLESCTTLGWRGWVNFILIAALAVVGPTIRVTHLSSRILICQFQHYKHFLAPGQL